ncbi:MAG TPA: KH domain-containing protein [Candidatus Entotheonella sp.]
MRHLLQTIVSALVDYPDAVEVRQVDGETTCILEIRVAPADIGKVIGRQGRNIASLRTLLNAIGAKEKKHILLEVLEDQTIPSRHLSF